MSLHHASKSSVERKIAIAWMQSDPLLKKIYRPNTRMSTRSRSNGKGTPLSPPSDSPSLSIAKPLAIANSNRRTHEYFWSSETPIGWRTLIAGERRLPAARPFQWRRFCGDASWHIS
jgi:hypothetical protein